MEERYCKNCNKMLTKRQKKFCSHSCCSSKTFSGMIRKQRTLEHKIKLSESISKANKGRKLSEETKQKLSEIKRGIKFSDEHKRKLSISLIGNKNASRITDIGRKKLRISAINNVEKYRGKLKCFIGKNETKLLNEIEKLQSINIQRQYKINELGYIVDGYDKENNVVYEVYEPSHYKSNVRIQKDLQRQKEIEDFLKCKFIIIEDIKRAAQ